MKVRIGVSGDVGSFSEAAAIHYANVSKLAYELHYLIDMEKVLAALDANEIDTGVFPVYNNRGGIVAQAFTAMGNHLFTFMSSFPIEIEQCLLTKTDIPLNQITAVASHSQGLAQCLQFIKEHLPHATVMEAKDTALAARDLASGRYEDTVAVIAPAACATHYGLMLKQRAIHDVTPNQTTFIVVA